jgi:hypothetical protein
VLYCIAGAWTDFWYDDPGAWWQWCVAFKGWTTDQWRAFYGRWRTAPERKRQELMATTGLRFFDWQRVPGGSMRGSTKAAATLIAEDLAQLPSDSDVTLLGHSKGGHAIKRLLAAGPAPARPAAAPDVSGKPGGPGERGATAGTGARPARAIFVDAPLDSLREIAGRLMGLSIERCRLDVAASGVPCVTINNWLDPSGGRLRGAANYQTLVWQDYLNPYPPHGMKGFLAARVLREIGAIAGDDPRTAYAVPVPGAARSSS